MTAVYKKDMGDNGGNIMDVKCTNCGHGNNEGARFCQNCGYVLSHNQNFRIRQINRLFRDDLFMVLCILYSISVGASLANVSVSTIIGIFMTIFLWLIFAQSRKGNVDAKYMRYISGTIFVSYVIRWIGNGIVILCGAIFAILSFSMNAEELWGMSSILNIESYIDDYLGFFGSFISSYLLVLSFILIIAAIIGMVLNVLGWRSIHRFARSVYRNFEDGHVRYAKCRAAQTWLRVFGILCAIYAVFSLVGGDMAAFLDGCCLSAARIIGSVLVNRYFGSRR